MLRKLIALCAVFFMLCGAATAGNPEKISILYVKQPFNLQNMVMKKNRLLEKEFAADGIQIEWKPIGGGARQAQALASGSVDLVAVMNTASLLIANAAGNKIYIAAGVAKPSRLFSLVSGKYASIPELKGKTVGGPKGTVLHQLLAESLKDNGMSMSDVHFIHMNQQAALSALLAGKIDAALLSGMLLRKAVDSDAFVLSNAADKTGVTLTLAAGRKFAEKHPELLERVVKVHRQALQWILDNRAEAEKIGAQECGLTPGEARELADQYGYTGVFTEEDARNLAKTRDFLRNAGLINQTVDVESLVLPMARQ